MHDYWEKAHKAIIAATDNRGVAEFARRVGVDRKTVEAWRRGTYPGTDILGKIAEVLGMQPWELIKPDSALPTPVPEQPGVAQLLEAIEKLNTALKEAQKSTVPADMQDIVEAISTESDSHIKSIKLDTLRSVLGIRKKPVKKDQRKIG